MASTQSGDYSGEEKTAGHSLDTELTRTSRGRTHCDKVVRQRVQGIRKDVRFNKLGQPVGEEASEMQSYIGVLARQKVNINYKTWKSVPSEVKELIWESVNLAFNVDPGWKKGCLSSANTKWRQYKAQLTRDFILNNIQKPEYLNEPPRGHGITRDDWSSFVISRMSEDFIKLSGEQSERRKKNKYPHRLSRKGYARYAEEIADELGDDDEINRAIIWKKGRATKDGNIIGNDLREAVEKIDDYIQQKREDMQKFQGPSDSILTMALASQEHTGRVRGLGSYVTPSMYFNTGRTLRQHGDDRGHQQELLEARAHIAQQAARLSEQEARLQKLEEQEIRIKKLEDMLGRFAYDRTSVDEKGSCSGNKLTWGDDEVPHTDVVVQVLSRDEFVQVQPKKRTETKNTKKNTSMPLDVPTTLHMLKCFCQHVLADGSTIAISLDHAMFDADFEILVLNEDIIPFYELEPISCNCIVVYMWYLYQQLRDADRMYLFRFVNPYLFPYMPCASKLDKNGRIENLNEKAKVLANRLNVATINQLFLMPCNVGFHWVLYVIDPFKELVYLLDPLSHHNRFDDWKYVVEMALKLFNTTKGRKGKKVRWEVVKAPRQPDSKQCGYYVLNFMRDIVQADETIVKDSLHHIFKGHEYTKEEIDEMRSEWAGCIQRHVK